MKLLVEIHKVLKDKPKVHDHNFVAKHAVRGGAGVHAEKSGPHASRARQKKQWKKDIKENE